MIYLSDKHSAKAETDRISSQRCGRARHFLYMYASSFTARAAQVQASYSPIAVRSARFGMSTLLSSGEPVYGEVSCALNQSVMAVRSYV